MTELTKIEDHEEQALAQLITQYRDKPDLEHWIRSYARESQELEDVLWDIIEQRTVDSATGDLLQKIGKIVGQPYRGEGDEAYRVLVKARIAINRSNGQWRDLRTVTAVLLADASRRWATSGTMSLKLRIDEQLSDRPGLEQVLIEAAAQAGVRVDLTYSVDPDTTDRFAFGSEGGGFQDSGLRGAVSSWRTE